MADNWTRMQGLSDYNPCKRKPTFHPKHNQEFCKSWFRSSYNQPELNEVQVVYAHQVAPKEFEVMLQFKNSEGLWDTVEWLGTACCDFNAMAKALSDFKDEYR